MDFLDELIHERTKKNLDFPRLIEEADARRKQSMEQRTLTSFELKAAHDKLIEAIIHESKNKEPNRKLISEMAKLASAVSVLIDDSKIQENEL